MYQNSSLCPKFLDSNSIYTLLRKGDGYELLQSRIREDMTKRGLFGNYGNCCLIPETKELLLSSSAVRNSFEAENFICSLKELDYLEDKTFREQVESKRREISQHPQCQLNIENPAHKEILYLAAISLISKGTIVTNNLEVFNKEIEKNLLLEDWTYKKDVICVRDNKPGLLYKVSRLIGENDVLIVRAINQKDRHGNDLQNNFEFVIDVCENDIPSDIKRRLANVIYKPCKPDGTDRSDGSHTKILFNHLRRKNDGSHSSQILFIEGRDRKNLLADIAYFPFYKKYNILVSNSSTVEESRNFSIGFVFDRYLFQSEKEWLENEISKKVNCVNSVYFTDYNNTLVS